MNTDLPAGEAGLTFITNKPEANLLDRFRALIKDAKFFDNLVGYLFR